MLEIKIDQAGYTEGKSVIHHIHFNVQAGELVGLIGGNGAGKSTTIQTLLQTIPHFKGDISIPAFGYVPERPILYTYYTLREHIHLLLQLHGQQYWTRALELCQLFRLEKHLDEYPLSFSKGMQQKVMLVLAFTPSYDFYILDEPFMGLDPHAIRRLLLLLQDLKENGAGILLSTHALDTAERICDRFVCLHEGKLIRQGTLQSLKRFDEQSLLEIFDELIEGVQHAAL